jgi:F-type H+-transporting ATPase subunit a
MEEHVSPITQFVNHYLGAAAFSLLQALHITPDNPEFPIPQHVVMGLVVLAIATALALIVRSRLSVESPGAIQQVGELLLTNPMRLGIRDVLEEAAGQHYNSFIYFVGAISLFVLFSNLMSLFPLFSAPTGHQTVPLACAILTFIYFNYQGIRYQGVVTYLKHFGAGSPWWIAWLIFVVEIISTLARLLSLTVRLYANIFASDTIYVLFLGLLTQVSLWGWNKSPVLGVVLGIFPALIPLLFIGLHLLVAVIQTFIFTVLPSVYLGMATAEEH